MSKRFDETYKQALGDILKHGHEAKPRQFITKELFGFQCQVNTEEPVLLSPARKLNFAFAVAEWLWIFFGREDAGFISQFNKRIMTYSDDGVKFYGAYGPRFKDQLSYAYTMLKQDPQTRRAVMTFWRPNPHADSLDIPCTVGLHFIARAGKLNCFSWMRSNDAYLGLPYDVFNFSQLTNCLAGMLGLQRGTLYYNADSLHLYQDQFSLARQVAQEPAVKEKINLPAMTDIKDLDEYDRVRELFNQLADKMTAGPVEDEEILGRLPDGLGKYMLFLNSYLMKNQSHKLIQPWRQAYDCK